MARKWKREGSKMAAIVIPSLRATAHRAVDRTTTYAKQRTQAKIQSVGLGRLSRAVGSTSSLRKAGYAKTNNAWGAIFARGGTESRGNQALLAYSEGATIFPRPGRKWLAFATDAIPKRAGRFKMTPARYKAAGLESKIGKLVFVKGRKKEAYLIAKNVTVSRRTRKAKAFGGKVPRGADRARQIVAFILIPFTKRAQRFSQIAIMQDAQAQFPKFALEAQADRAR